MLYCLCVEYLKLNKTMIQAEQLRIGNLIINPIQGIIKVNTTIMSRVNNLNSLIKQGLLTKEDIFKPIPLTEDILLKCGFEDRGHYFVIYGKIALEVFEKGFTLCNHEYKPFIMYLHELQNLYYALTKQELDITKILEDGNSL